MNDSTAHTELSELARKAAWGLVKGGDLDALSDGRPALRDRLDVLDAAARAGIHIDLEAHGIGEIYTRAEIDR